MLVKKIFSILVLTVLLSPFCAYAHEDNNEQTEPNVKTEIKEYIGHHLQDSYDFTIWQEYGIGFSLPIILIDDGLHFFMSSKFNHGESVAESNGNYYKVFHGKIYRTDLEGTIEMGENHHPTNIKPLDFSITKNVASILFISLLIFWLFRSFAKSYQHSMIPNKKGRILEPLVLFIRDDIAIPNIGKKSYGKYMPYLLTVFFFVWFLNLAGMTPLGIGVTNNIAVTFGLALITFIITQFTAKKSYWGHIFWMPDVPVPMKIILAPIELLGVFVKPFALMIRLYANMTAGHVVVMSIIGLIYVFNNWFATGSFLILTLFLSVLELLVAFLQAYIFTMLTALYFGAAAAEHDDHH